MCMAAARLRVRPFSGRSALRTPNATTRVALSARPDPLAGAVSALSPVGLQLAIRPPQDAPPRNQPNPFDEQQDPVNTDSHPGDQPCGAGSVIGCLDQTRGDDVELVGAPFRLYYRTDRTPGRVAANR